MVSVLQKIAKSKIGKDLNSDLALSALDMGSAYVYDKLD